MERKFAPIDITLNAAVNTIARKLFPCGYDVTPDASEAPSTMKALCERMDAGGSMLVWSGASDHTIFDCPETNWAFRAWHDWHHWQGRLPFTLMGEATVAERQIKDLETVYGKSPITKRWAKIIRAEVVGQIAHEMKTGSFPIDQKAFVLEYLATH